MFSVARLSPPRTLFRMLMVIFGAGASYDSLADISPGVIGKDLRPPLANQLFERRSPFEPAVQEYWECRPIIPQLRQLSQDTYLEKVLETLRAEGEYDEHRKQEASPTTAICSTVFGVGALRVGSRSRS